MASVDAEVPSAGRGRGGVLGERNVHDIAVKPQSLRYSWEISGDDVKHLDTVSNDQVLTLERCWRLTVSPPGTVDLPDRSRSHDAAVSFAPTTAT